MSMNPFKALFKIDWSGRKMRMLDISLAVVGIIVGLAIGSEFWTWVGVAALVMSILNPMGRLQKGVSGFKRPAPGNREAK